ncbi:MULTISPECIES: oxaloacetate decarboxylase [Acetomicrobium]|jgi:2-methylisocitrate lyase-like PEP mutase family enzyme|uniref:isocitrate lyase/PEP mutase family protein n=1 Tax=Acetomicrobium TaxID=49894 RepID=UPI0026F1B76F|nr:MULTISPECIES: oxaloacetate decarboxylase [Acetomicrobium]MDI9377514.1 oxaloacetate decarboxylase [Synergistota bacterium]MDR9769019.1 oxaloacetate decarboxylase [Acetomicrobium sp.]HOB10964.1 oxaloacetate decarboxylase [Acetomicrobium sp.]HQA36942.1 oxaloacetate decarboxylase [Acetomicrobium sp.]HQC88047.1 oxaloacetate decarboxylase [Acetomicrobium sp.]
MKKSTLLKNMIMEKKALVCPGAHDVMSAKLIERAGFKACQVSGFGLSATYLGLPDMAFLSFAEALNFSKNIIDAVNIPVMVDADTGFGNAVNAMRVTEEFIKIGAAGMNIEDQVFPKRCGHLEGKQIIPMEEMVLKIKACIEVKKKLDPDFVVNARTDAIAVSGVEEAIKRGNAYAEAGADLIFIEAPRTREDIIRLVKEIKAPISINLFDAVSGGKTPLIDIDELKEMGVARVSIPVGPLFAAVKGMMNYLDVIKDGIAEGRTDLVVPFAEFKELVGFNKYRELEKKFLPEYIP